YSRRGEHIAIQEKSERKSGRNGSRSGNNEILVISVSYFLQLKALTGSNQEVTPFFILINAAECCLGSVHNVVLMFAFIVHLHQTCIIRLDLYQIQDLLVEAISKKSNPIPKQYGDYGNNNFIDKTFLQ